MRELEGLRRCANKKLMKIQYLPEIIITEVSLERGLSQKL